MLLVDDGIGALCHPVGDNAGEVYQWGRLFSRMACGLDGAEGEGLRQWHGELLRKEALLTLHLWTLVV